MTNDKSTPEQQSAPVAQPAPQPQFSPQQEQPQQVQYIVSQRSLEGIGGWLIFWIIVFILFGIGYIMVFFTGLEEGGTRASEILSMIFSPLLAIGFLGSATTIALRRKLGVWVSVGTISLTGLFAVLNIIIMASEDRSTSIAMTVGGVLVSIVLFGAMSLYFFASKRVKQTLTK